MKGLCMRLKTPTVHLALRRQASRFSRASSDSRPSRRINKDDRLSKVLLHELWIILCWTLLIPSACIQYIIEANRSEVLNEVYSVASGCPTLLDVFSSAGRLQHHVLRAKWGRLRLPSEWWAHAPGWISFHGFNGCECIHTVVNVSEDEKWDPLCLFSCGHFRAPADGRRCSTFWFPCNWLIYCFKKTEGIHLSKSPTKQFITSKPPRHRLKILL